MPFIRHHSLNGCNDLLGIKEKVSPFLFNSGLPSTIIDTHLSSPSQLAHFGGGNVQTISIAGKSFPFSRGVAPETRCHVLVWLSGPSSELTGSVSFYEYIVMDIFSRGQKEYFGFVFSLPWESDGKL